MTAPADVIVATAVGPSEVPEAILSLGAMADADYVDVCTATTAAIPTRSPEEWARAVIEETPAGRSAPRLWRLLGLRLGPRPSPDHVQGWRIADRGDDWIRVEATSWWMTAHAVVRVDGAQVSLALLVRFDRPVAALVWPPVALLHRRGAPVMLRQAIRGPRPPAPFHVPGGRGSGPGLRRPRTDGGPTMRVPNTEHTSRPWRIHEITHDFRLEDVWEVAAPGGPDDFDRAVELMASLDPAESPSCAVRSLFAIRWRLGEALGWDDEDAGVGARVPTLRDRLPADLRDGPPGPEFEALPFTSLYRTGDEWAAEVANRTMHGVLHLGLVPDGEGGHRGQMAVYVKRNGLLGTAYMAAIRPFRHLVVYPPMLRRFEEIWRERAADPAPAPAR